MDGRLELIGPKGKAVLEVDDDLAALASRLRDGIPEDEARSLPATSHSFISRLVAHDFLVIVPQDATRTEQWIAHASRSASAVSRLQGSSAVVIGCGGTGSVVADHLVRVGIRRLVLIDDAVLDRPDLNRQLPYRVADIGKSKVEALAAHLHASAADPGVGLRVVICSALPRGVRQRGHQRLRGRPFAGDAA